MQDYHSMYIDLYNELRPKSDENKENINDDLVFEMELIKQVEINIDYILELIRQYHDSHLNNKEILVDIDKAVNSSIELRNKKDLIEQFIASLTVDSSVDGDWQEFVKSRKIKELDQIIDDEKLDKKRHISLLKMLFAMAIYNRLAQDCQGYYRQYHDFRLMESAVKNAKQCWKN